MSIFWIKFTPRLHLGNQQKIHLWMMTFTYQTGQGRNTLGFDKLPARKELLSSSLQKPKRNIPSKGLGLENCSCWESILAVPCKIAQ